MILNEKTIASLKVGKERKHYYDNKQANFGIRVEVNARKSFFWFKKVRGKPRYKALGEFPITTLKDARAEADKWAAIAATWKRSGYTGDDPFEKPATVTPVAAVAVPMFQAMLDAYCSRHIQATANHPDRAETNVRWLVKKHFSAWLDRPIDSITVEDMLTIKNGLGKRHYMANRTVEFCRSIFNWSGRKTDGQIHFWPIAENPAKDVSMYDEAKRDRFLQPEEMVRFDAALKNEPDAELRDFLTLALATGARRENLLAMRWQDIAWERRTWVVPMSKSGQGYSIELLPNALSVLERRRASAPEDSIFVFPGIGRSGHLINVLKRWHIFRKRAGIPDVRLHDLRRTCGAYQAIAGISLQQIGASLGHRSMGSTLIYARLHQEAVRDARQSGQDKMRSMMLSAAKRQKKLAGQKARPLLTAASR